MPTNTHTYLQFSDKKILISLLIACQDLFIKTKGFDLIIGSKLVSTHDSFFEVLIKIASFVTLEL